MIPSDYKITRFFLFFSCAELLCFSCLLFITAELSVEFSQSSFTGPESSGSVVVSLLLGRGTADRDISVIVTPSDQSPVSAQGKRCVS